MNDIYEVLRSEHELLLRTFDQIIQGGAKDDGMFKQAKDMFTAHKDAEEDTLYTTLEQDGQLRPMIQVARMEHHAANTLFRETDWMTFNEEKWMAKVKVLREMIGHHIEKEEGPIFQEARRVLSETDAREIGMRFQEEEAA